MPPVVQWSNARDCDRVVLFNWTEYIFQTRICNNTNCSIRQHIHVTLIIYSMIICNAISVSSLERSSTCKKHCVNFQDYIVPGWNDYVKEAHTEARYYYILWHDMRKPWPSV